MTGGLIEYVLVHDLGKVHESLLSTPVTPFELNIVLLLLNYRADPEWFVPPAKPKPLTTVAPAAQCEVLVRLKEAKETRKSVRIESWVWNLRSASTAAEAPWIYSGSSATEDGRFAAQVDGTHIALYLDPRCVFNSPRDGNDDDQLWQPARGVPAKGTAVTVIFRPFSPTAANSPAAPPAEKSGVRPLPPGDSKRKLNRK